jgi:redox-sensitive bicupin YhaK (pirin superfamily)
MLTLYPSNTRGHARFPWLDATYSFSFGEYHDERRMGFGALRVINEDRVIPAAGFDPHGHRDMEIFTYVLEGQLRHNDSLGNEGVLKHGTVQLMSAGRGIRHSEHNASETEPLHLLQIWIYPQEKSLDPSYVDKSFPVAEEKNTLHLMAAPDGKNGALTIHQDARIYAGIFTAGHSIALPLKKNRQAWLQVANGTATLGELSLSAGDGVAITEESNPVLTAKSGVEFLFFDLAHEA